MTLNGKQFGQLPLFVQAKELRNHYDSWELEGERSPEHRDVHYDFKAQEAHQMRPAPGSSDRLYESIRRTGVHMPVNIAPAGTGYARDDRPMLLNGNHRVGVQHEINPEAWVPVNVTDDPFENEDRIYQAEKHDS